MRGPCEWLVVVLTSGNWFVYVVRCGDESLYTGMSGDVARRLAEHKAGRGGRYTRAHLPVTLVAAWRFPSRREAMSAEARFKRLRRNAKLQLIQSCSSLDDAPFVAQAVLEAAR